MKKVFKFLKASYSAEMLQIQFLTESVITDHLPQNKIKFYLFSIQLVNGINTKNQFFAQNSSPRTDCVIVWLKSKFVAADAHLM